MSPHPSHNALVVPIHGERRTIYCCNDGTTRHETSWNQSDSKVASMVWGTPSEVFDRIVAHLTKGRSDEFTRTIVAAAASVVALGGNVDEGLRMLDEHLPGINITFDPEPDDTDT